MYVRKVTTGTAGSRSTKAQGMLREWKDKQHRHPGMFHGQLQKNEAIYEHAGLSSHQWWCVAVIMLQGLQTTEISVLNPQQAQIPTSKKSAHPFASIYPTDLIQVHQWNSGHSDANSPNL